MSRTRPSHPGRRAVYGGRFDSDDEQGIATREESVCPVRIVATEEQRIADGERRTPAQTFHVKRTRKRKGNP